MSSLCRDYSYLDGLVICYTRIETILSSVSIVQTGTGTDAKVYSDYKVDYSHHYTHSHVELES